MFGLIFLIVSIIDFYICSDDGELNVLVNLINNPQTSCLQFAVGNNSRSIYPLYIHWKYPIMSKIINDQMLHKHYAEEVITIEKFIHLFDGYLVQLNDEKSEVPIHSYRQNIRYILISLRRIHSNIKLIGLCLKDNFINSENDEVNDYLCREDLASLNISMKPTEINKKIYHIYWEPVTCSSLKNSIRFPVRLIYNFQNSTSTLSRFYFEFDIREFNLNQCEAELHRCKEETTKCIYHQTKTQRPFATGNYYCQCRKGFFLDPRVQMFEDFNFKGFPGHQVEREFLNFNENDPNKSEYFRYDCQPCGRGCDICINNKPCSDITDNALVRGLPLAIQSFCITLCIVTAIIVFQLRRSRVIKNSNWILLELFLLGAIVIYSMIINSYFKATEITCAIQPFLREGGFVIMYGVLYVKVYRVLCSFQSRKAQRVYFRDKDILRYLSVLIIICFGHLIAWVATSFDHKKSTSYTPFSEIQTRKTDLNYIQLHSCRSRFWDIVSYMYETALMAITIYYCKCVKSAPSEYGEVRFITIAVVNEMIFSLAAVVARMTIRNNVFLINFLHCHVTTTVSVALLIGPKLWYLYRPPILSAGRPRLVPHSETHIIQTQQKLNGEVDLVEINLAEMDSETIRDELKRLYTQLEIYKSRAMRKENPHVSKKKGGRKQRRFSIQHFHKKHHTSGGHDDETSKISEDSPGNSGGEDTNLTSSGTKQI